ncbi:cytochrome P450 [Promicromonospora sp. AC04]|uniref:cytochrome P450 n=1 Tax=Promicromonospora sp. AC04 TaxID=2135723 RepID=UPI000D37596A|nr:cytochrome P450 [Promicromonospora sp. AC04]
MRLDDAAGLTDLVTAIMSKQDIYPQLRAEWGPIAAVDLIPGVPAWLAMDWDDVMDILRSPATFTRDVGTPEEPNWPAFFDGRVPPYSGLAAFCSPRANAYYTDGWHHERLRAAVDHVFAEVDEKALGRYVRQMCDRMLDRIVKRGTETDLVANYTAFVPALAVAYMYEFDDEDALKLGDLAKAIFSYTEAAGPAFDELYDMLYFHIEARRDAPADQDMLTGLMHWQDPVPGRGPGTYPDHDYRYLDRDELRDTAQMILSAGFEMAVAYTTTTLEKILSDRGLATWVRRGRLDIPETLDWVLVRKSPVRFTPPRYVTADVVLGGRLLRKGDAIVTAVAHATLDKHTDTFDPYTSVGIDPIWSSTSRASLAFGAGPHRCPAHRFSRIVVEAAVDRAVNRLPGMQLTVPADDLGTGLSLWASNADRLPVRYQHAIDHASSPV